MKNLSLLLALATIFVLSSCGSSSAPIAVKLSPSTAQAIDQGQQVSFTASVANDSTNAGVTWACSGTACTALTGVSTTAATFSATGTTGTATIAATSKTLTTASSSVPVTVTALPAITTTQAQVTAATAGNAYNLQLTESGGAGKLTWSATGLPANGLSINSSTGAISGTPTAKGAVTFTVTVTDSSTAGPKTASAPFTITVNNPAPPAITTTQAQVTAAPATAGSVYGFTFHANGTGALTWSAVGLPSDGLSLAASTGIVSGTPTSKATVSFTLTVSDSFGQSSAATPFTITVNNPAAPVITTTQAQVTAAPGTVGTAYSFTFHATGTGALTWSAAGLPADALSLAASTGIVSGTPTSKTTVSFTLTASDTFGQSSAATPFIITVNNPAPPVISTTPAQVPSATVNVAYNFTFHGSGFAPLTWSTTPALSDGLSMSTAGVVTGTPTTATTLTFSVSLTDGLGQVTTVTGFSIVVSTESIAFTPSAPSTVTAGGTLSVNATVSGDAGNGGVNWTVTCGSSACGSFTASHTASGTATTYDAPPQPPTGGTVTITATAADAPSPQVSAVVTVNAQPLVFTTNSLPSGTVNAAYNATITASGGVPPYTFSLDATSAALPANLTFNPGSPSATITGTPAATGTTSGIIVDVKDSEATPMTNQVTFSLTINAVSAACVEGGSESLLKGQYAFVLEGFDDGTGTGETSPEPFLVGGVLTFNGTDNSGSITAGTIDINGNSTTGVQTNAVTSGSYGVGSDQRGCMVITTSAGTQNYRFSLGNISSGVASTGHVINFDSAGPFTAGVLRKQTSAAFSTSQVTGNYAFGVSSPQNSASCNNSVCGGAFGAVGVFNLSAGTVTGGEVDFNSNGELDASSTTAWAGTAPSIDSGGTYTISSTNGRGTLTFTPGGTGSSPVHAVIYVVSSTDVLVLNSDDQTNNSLFAGEMLKQSGTFSANPLSGAYIGYQSGQGTTNGTSRATLLLLNASGTGLSGTQLRNDGGSFQEKSLTGITYSVTSSGRMTVTGGGTNPPIFYLVSANEVFALNGSSTVDSGFFQSQTGSPFTNSSASGVYAFGTFDPQDANGSDKLGVATFTPGTTTVSVIQDSNGNGSQSLDKTQSMSYSIDSTGLVSIPSGCSITAIPTTCQALLYVISPTKAALMDVGSTNPDIQVADQ
jgi:hypothetical protein